MRYILTPIHERDVSWLMMTSLICICMLVISNKALHMMPLHRNIRMHFNQVSLTGGDLLLYSCSGLQADATRFLYNCEFTHVGMVVQSPQGEPLLWQTTRKGAHLRALCECPTTLRHMVVVRQLSPPLSHAQHQALHNFATNSQGQAYSHDYWKAVYNRWFPYLPLPIRYYRNFRQGRFCTDLIAQTLHHIGVLNFDHSNLCPTDLLPMHFTENHEKLPLAHPFHFGPEVLLLPQ